MTWSNPQTGHARAFSIAACAVYSHGEATYYHYPCFYLLHHAAELLIKTKFNIIERGHYLTPLIETNKNAKNYFSQEEIDILKKSDELNGDIGQLRYYSEPHKVFEWEIVFDGLLDIIEKRQLTFNEQMKSSRLVRYNPSCMTELKTKLTSASPLACIKAIEDDEKRADSLALLKIFAEATGEKSRLWGTSIIGYGQYHYESERSAQKGDWMLTGFSPRKANLTLYIMPGFKEYGDLMKVLGKYKVSSGSCIYIKRLSDIDTAVLTKLIQRSVADMKKRYPEKEQTEGSLFKSIN